MRKIWAVAFKEFRQIGRDWLFLAMLVGLPAFMLVVFGYAVNFDITDLRIAVEDRDLTPSSRALTAAFVNSGRFRIARELRADEDLHAIFQTGGARVAIIIPEHFERDLISGRRAPVQLVFDGADANTAATALGYAGGVLQTFNAARLSRAFRASGIGAPTTPAIAVEPRVWYNPELESSHFLVPGLIGFILMITAVLSTALSVVREKERGTMEQLSVAPLNTVQVLLGKTLPFLLISLLAVVLILAAAHVLFGVVVAGSYLDLFAVTALYLLCGLGLGLLFSTVARNQAVAFQMGIFSSMLPTLLLSGFVFPIRNMPLILQVLSYAVPARYYLAVLRGIVLKGTSLSAYPFQVATLAAFALALVGLASTRFSRMEV